MMHHGKDHHQVEISENILLKKKLNSFLDYKIPEISLPNKNLCPSNVVDHIPLMTTS